MKKILKEKLEKLIERKQDEDYKNTIPVQAFNMNIPEQTFRKYVNGISDCSISNLTKIAKYYNVSTDYLLGLAKEPTSDKDLNAVCEYIGLSSKAVQKLCEISKKNHATANSDTLSLLVEDDDFNYFLALLSGKMCDNENEDISFSVGNARTTIRNSDITDYSITHTITDITDRMKNKYNSRFSTVDERLDFLMQQKLFRFAESLYQEGRITDEEYKKVIEEYKKGNFDYELQRQV